MVLVQEFAGIKGNPPFIQLEHLPSAVLHDSIFFTL